MKILFYNWAPLNSVGLGGGVAVYVRNFFKFFENSDERKNIQMYFISSGWFYDNKKRTYVREESKWGDVKIYSIINSPISAPHRFAITQLKDFFKQNCLKKLFKTFIEENGPFDVIHFQSLEGVSLDVLELKEDFPKSKFIYSVHDYGLFCPNVRLWTYKHSNCYTDKIKCECSKCMRKDEIATIRNFAIRFRPSRTDSPQNDVQTQKSSHLKVLGKNIIKKILTRLVLFFKQRNRNSDYLLFRKRNIENINRYVDDVLCVSNRVAEIAENYGIKKDKLRVSYIGTEVAERALYQPNTKEDTEKFTILYMGYAAVEKGFFYMLDVLEEMPKDFCSSTVLKFATKINDSLTKERIEKLKVKYSNVIVYDGYSHADFPEIMKDVNLGIVPPLWEDNLPQVTIEMIANGVPVLTSSFGGAHELNHNPNFVFDDRDDFVIKVQEIKNNRVLLVDYWKDCCQLTTMKMHWRDIMDIYKKNY